MSIADLDCLSMCSSCYFVVMYTAIKTVDIVLMKFSEYHQQRSGLQKCYLCYHGD